MDLPKTCYVEWTDHDSLGAGPWMTKEEALEHANEPVMHCHSVGWLLHETDEMVCLVSTVAGGEVGTKVERILKTNIVKMQRGALIDEGSNGRD